MLTRRSFVASAVAACSLFADPSFGSEPLPRDASGGDPREYHVSVHGDDAHDGSSSAMLRSIGAAAAKAYPGDTITVHEGIYREHVDPPRGGLSETERITYQAAPGERVEISGAEVVTGWARVQDGVWKLSLPNSLFGDFNPYSDVLHGDWFYPKNRQLHTGAVYANGDWLKEAIALHDVLQPTAETPLWFAQVDETHTSIWAQFGEDPAHLLTEINVRQTVFYPKEPGRNYITVRGFIMRQAATPWAPPTAEQKALLGTHWSRGWIIENNRISHSVCAGISLGKYGDEFDNKSGTANGYVQTIERATKHGWSKYEVGHHVVRGNTVSHCEQAGIVGSLGAIFSVISDNSVHDIYVRRLYDGAEMAGIKIHAAIDVKISRNRVFRSFRGLWLDWMAQGTHISRNLFHDNDEQDLFVEVDHGPFVVENNLFLSRVSQRTLSQGGAYAHNLFCGGTLLTLLDKRLTPFMKAHSTEIVGLHDNPCGDMRFYNNIFLRKGDLSAFDGASLPMHLAGNVFLEGAKPCTAEADPLVVAGFASSIDIVSSDDSCRMTISLDPAWATHARSTVTSELLGKALIPNLPFERPDGAGYRIDRDYLGSAYSSHNPFPGPFSVKHSGRPITLWPLEA